VKKLTRKQWQTLRMNYDYNTVWQIEQNIIEIVNKYSKDHNLKGLWKTMFIRETKNAFVTFYDLMPKKSDYDLHQMFLNNALRVLRKYNIVPYDNVMSFKYNILSKFGNAWKEKRKEYLRFCTENNVQPRKYENWRNTLEMSGSRTFL